CREARRPARSAQRAMTQQALPAWPGMMTREALNKSPLSVIPAFAGMTIRGGTECRCCAENSLTNRVGKVAQAEVCQRFIQMAVSLRRWVGIVPGNGYIAQVADVFHAFRRAEIGCQHQVAQPGEGLGNALELPGGLFVVVGDVVDDRQLLRCAKRRKRLRKA